MGFWRIHPATFSTSILLTARLVQSVFHLPLTRITLWTFHPFILHHRDFRYSPISYTRAQVRALQVASPFIQHHKSLKISVCRETKILWSRSKNDWADLVPPSVYL